MTFSQTIVRSLALRFFCVYRAFLLIPAAIFLLSACTGALPEDTVNRVTEPCRLQGMEQAARCGSIQVAENPAEPLGKKIPVHFAVIPAAARIKTADPLFIFAGGPGQSAQLLAGQIGKVFNSINRKRDLVFIDQRGTGESNGLECLMPGPNTPLEDAVKVETSLKALNLCRQQLIAQGQDLRWYVTHIAVKDFDAVRARLGLEKINIWGGSYGTRVALEYTRQFPSRVRSLVLDGVAPADQILPVQMALDTDTQLNNLISVCKNDQICNKQYPNLKEKLNALLSPKGAELALTDQFTGEKRKFWIDAQSLAGVIRSPLYTPPIAAVLPHAVNRAAQGEGDPLFALGAILSSNTEENFSMGMHMAVVCAEDMPRIDENALKVLEGKFIGRAYVDQYQAMCKDWPLGQVPLEFYEPVKNDVPVLILSGGLDPVTPPRHGKQVAQWFKRVQHLIMPAGGHIVSTQPCAAKLITDFIKSAGSQVIDGSCLEKIPAPLLFSQLIREGAEP